MTSVSGSLWPYVLMTVGWVIVCAYFLYRAWAQRAASMRDRADARSSRPAYLGSDLQRDSRIEARDTQAGRI
jgi:hypothetical protein